MLKSYGVAWWVVAHVIFVSAQVLLVLTLFGTLDFGISDLGLTKTLDSVLMLSTLLFAAGLSF